ncbi:hypothetical protein [Cellulophaga sp. E6(2014)]|uniref:hypothetical protein n=1 Tax=Cellulophaga sp. E6(2014) TaxID=1495334 RepID=UPI00051DC6B6|nr:hypothetical protein [Cellulophaga sp. E6(2014)]KGK30527.1 hypothetical protein EL45_08935 [Cellulophaga sp. E6(2014)]
MTNIDLDKLQSFLSQNEIPTVKQQIGFLELIKKPHNETINSNIYAHFLSCNINIIKHAFLDALTSIIEEKTNKVFRFSMLDVRTEYPTNTGRIDIVIQDLISHKAILIENKIYHRLDNDLKEYWNFFTIDDANKVGVLLTLKPHDIPSDVFGKFINITHWEWISAVKETLDINSIKDKAYKLYVNDFFNTIENISTTYKMNESAKFFFENASQVNNANVTLVEGHSYLNTQYELIAEKLGLQTYGSDISWRNIWDEENRLDTFITIVTEDLTSGKDAGYKIVLELMRKDKDRVYELSANFQEHPQYKDKYRGISHGMFCHFLVKEYKISLNELDQFAEIVERNIKNDFNQIFIEVIEYLYPEKDIRRWKQNFSN